MKRFIKLMAGIRNSPTIIGLIRSGHVELLFISYGYSVVRYYSPAKDPTIKDLIVYENEYGYLVLVTSMGNFAEPKQEFYPPSPNTQLKNYHVRD